MSAQLFESLTLPLLMSQHGVSCTYRPSGSTASRSVTALIKWRQQTTTREETEDVRQYLDAVFFSDEANSHGGVAAPLRGDLLTLPAAEGGGEYVCTGNSRATREGMGQWEFKFARRRSQGKG